jgi:hypothetical protein
MRRIIPIFLLGTIATSFAFSGELTKEISFNKENLSIASWNGWNVVRLQGASVIYKHGEPELPFVPLTFCIPADAEVLDIEIISCERELLGEYDILPVQRAKPFSMERDFPFVEPDMKIYGSSAAYPEHLIEIGSSGSKGGFRLITVIVYPLRYIPATRDLYFYPWINFKLKYTEGKVIARSVRKHKRDTFLLDVKRLVENPEDVARFAPPTGLPYRSNALPIGDYEHVIIADDAYASIYEPLAYWKTKKGVPSKVVSLSYIYANYAGVDNPDRIRNFIKDAEATWGTLWFLLGGVHDDAPAPLEVVPRRDTWCVTTGVMSYPDEDTIAADLYFADLDGTWDGDGDGTYGEETDGIDMYSDVYVGRALVKNAIEATRFVDMILDYEKNPPAGYQAKILLTSENLFFGYDGVQVSDSIAKYDPAGFFDAKCYDEWGQYDDLASIDSMNLGYGFAHYAGHGAISGVMYGSGDPITSADLDNYLATGTKFGFHYAICCLPGAFDYDCYAEHLLLNPNDGCFNMLNYRYGWGILDYPGRSEWQNIWFTQAFTSEGYNHFGDAQARMKDRSVPYTATDVIARFCIYEYDLFADPETPFWTRNPDTLLVIHDAVVQGPTSNFTVSVRDNNGITPIDSALVCLWCKLDTNMYIRGYTDATGNVDIAVSPTIQSDTMWVTVTKYNYRPYEGYAIVNLGAPCKPVTYRLFTFARDYTTMPTLTFSATDNEGDDIEYRVFWDTLLTFATADSATTPRYSSGDTIAFTFPAPLIDGQTFWWKVKPRDPLGSNSWGLFSDVQSFAVETSLPTNTCSWYQTKGDQFNYNTFIGAAEVQGDSIVLSPSSSGHDTLFDEDFESAGLPPGWSVVNGGGNPQIWDIVNSGATNPPPNPGLYYASIIYPLAGSNPAQDNDDIISSRIGIHIQSNDLWLRYNWGVDVHEDPYYAGDSLTTWIRFFNGGAWSSWILVGTVKNADGSGTDSLNLTSYLPRDSVQIKWRFTITGGIIAAGQDASIDNVILVDSYSIVNTWGNVIGTTVAYTDLNVTYPRTSWGYLNWRESLGADSIGMQLEYFNDGTWALIPDADLPGNSSGFFSTSQKCSLNINNLSPVAYDTMRIVAHIYRPPSEASANPSLLEWEIGNLEGIIGIVETEAGIISVPSLMVYPTVFKQALDIRYSAEQNGEKTELKIYDVTGRLVKEFDHASALRGNQQFNHVTWYGEDDSDRQASAGIYFVKYETKNRTLINKVLMIK